MPIDAQELTRARESRAAIERLYIEMRHMLNKGSAKYLGMPGEVITDALTTLRPEIYGSMTDPERVELDGLIYVIDRLPKGIEECRYVKLISQEGYSDSHFPVLVPASRRRNCYRIDKEHMFIEVTRGRSDVYDILTHLTFLYIESRKIKEHALDEKGEVSEEWKKLESIIANEDLLAGKSREIALTYLSTILGTTFEKTQNACQRLEKNAKKNNGLFHVVYHLGKLSMEEELERKEREVSFTPTLKSRIGHHIYGERWANHIKAYLLEKKLLERPIHIISANMHSVMNTLYAWGALKKSFPKEENLEQLIISLLQSRDTNYQAQVQRYALKHGMHEIPSNHDTHISVQIFDTAEINFQKLPPEIPIDKKQLAKDKPVLIVMDYAFGEQAYESMDELLKPYQLGDQSYSLQVRSISVMGKAGILEGGKGDIMIPNAHIFEGTADNYPFHNDFQHEDFASFQGNVYDGPMITVLGTSLQNRDILAYFKNSTWNAIGLEMEGAHYQKAIQAQAYIRKNINKDVVLRYAYYASDNPLLTGSTLASGSLGMVGVKPTYLITRQILQKIFSQDLQQTQA